MNKFEQPKRLKDSFFIFLFRIANFLNWYFQLIKFLFISKKGINKNILGLIRICSLKRFFLLNRFFILILQLNLNCDEENRGLILNKISKMIQKFQLNFESKSLVNAHYLNLEISGWAKNESDIFLLPLDKRDIISKLKRKDVAQKIGKTYKNFGFKLVFKTTSELGEFLSMLSAPGSKIRESDIAIHGEFLNHYFLLQGYVKLSSNKNPSLNLDGINFTVDKDALNLDSFFVASLIFKFPTLFKGVFLIGNSQINQLLVHIFKRDKWYAYKHEFLTSNFVDENPDLFNSHCTPIEFNFEIQTSVEPQFYELKDTRVFHQRFILDKMRIFSNQFPEAYNSDLIAGVSSFLIKKSNEYSRNLVLVDSDNCLSLKSALLLPTRVPNNWFHFIFESLPGLLHFKNNLPLDIPILLHENCPSQIRELISAIGFRNFITVSQYHVLNIDTLFTFSSSAVIPDSLTIDLNDFKINFELIHKLSSYLNTFYSNKQDAVAQNSIYYVERKDRNRSVNRSFAFNKILSFSGCEKVNLSSYSVSEQFHFFSKCKVLLVEGGASMANFLFLKPNTKVLYLTSGHLQKYLLPNTIADSFGLFFHYVLGRIRIKDLVKVYSSYDYFHMNYKISIFKLFKALKRISRISLEPSKRV
jgi:hypothetical protein